MSDKVEALKEQNRHVEKMAQIYHDSGCKIAISLSLTAATEQARLLAESIVEGEEENDRNAT